MLFSSPSFLVFFLTVSALYFILPKKLRAIALLLASCFFYVSLSPGYLAVFGVLITLTFLLALGIEQKTHRRAYAIGGLLLNLGALCAFRYFNFFNTDLAALSQLLGWNYGAASLSLVLPIGLSFLVFQAVSYLVEVYRGNFKAERRFHIFALYMLFFPKVLAGPIERPAHLLPQLNFEKSVPLAQIRDGLVRMLWGFFKKLVIADNIAILVAHVYGNLSGADGPLLLILAILYPFQMYADFSGYSDIAIGAAAIFGIKLSDNFDRPFAARSITEYWRRWHISLSTWFRDYVYYPLTFGGKEKTKARRYVSLFLTFLLSGLWHGATLPYLAFGVVNGAFRVLDSSTAKFRGRVWSVVDRAPLNPSSALQILGTFSLTVISLTFFGAPSIHHAWYILSHVLLLENLSSASYVRELLTTTSLGISPTLLLAVIAAIVLMEVVQHLAAHGRTLETYAWFIRCGAYLFLVVAIALLGNFASIPFIYFQF